MARPAPPAHGTAGGWRRAGTRRSQRARALTVGRAWDSPVRSLIWIPVYAFFIIGLLLWSSYRLMARLFKEMTVVLFAYVFASFYAVSCQCL